MPEELVTYETDGPVAIITMVDEAHRNALSDRMRKALADACERLRCDETARVGVFTALGDKAFCAGADLKEMARQSVSIPTGYWWDFGERSFYDKVTIAAVNGPTLGGGVRLMQSMDLAIASPNAYFGMPEVRWGRGAPWSVPMARMLPRRVWMELALTGQPMSAQRAYELGFVNRVVPLEELRSTAVEWGKKIAEGAPLTIRATRHMVYMSQEIGVRAAWDSADEEFLRVYASEDALEGPRSFAEKRPAVWKGR